MLDEFLRKILKNILLPVPDKKDTLNSISFVDKINLCYRLGIINPKIRNVLCKINEIRNIFAHELKINSFSNAQIKKKMLELQKSSVIRKDVETESANSNREIFILTIHYLCGYLNAMEFRPLKVVYNKTKVLKKTQNHKSS